MYVQYNPNPKNLIVDDCTLRVIACAFDKTWEDVYTELSLKGYLMSDIPTSQRVFNKYLSDKDFVRHIIPNTCPDCYTINDFSREHPDGIYIVATQSHVITVKDGNIYDSWDSSMEVPIYYWSKR